MKINNCATTQLQATSSHHPVKDIFAGWAMKFSLQFRNTIFGRQEFHDKFGTAISVDDNFGTLFSVDDNFMIIS